MRKAALVAALLATFAIASQAVAQDFVERILDYNSDITVQKNGELNVVETITVNAQGENIRHGIYRDFPTIYTTPAGQHVHVRFDVQSVTMDGHDEHYEIDGLDNGKRVKIGDADTLLDDGKHTFVITYVTDRQVGFFQDYDELYWNVTGTGWMFEIDHVTATVHLPDGAHIIQDAFYTGSQGSTGRDAQATSIAQNAMRFETTGRLYANEGLTIAVGFNKGVVQPPTPTDKFWDFVRDNAGGIIALIGLAALFIYFMVTWVLYGRDPAHGVIIPLFSPPKDFSPPAVRYVHRMAYDRKAYAAALIDMAVKGYMKIADAGSSTYKLTRTGKSEQECGLAASEAAIGGKLFGGPNDSIELKQTNHTDIAASIAALQSSLKNEYERKYFVTNFGWFMGGIGILALIALLAALLSDDAGASAGELFWIGGWSVGTSFLVYRAFTAWRDAIHAPRGRVSSLFGAVFLSIFAAFFVIGLLLGLAGFGMQDNGPAMVALTLGGILCIVFYHLLKAPTALGGHIRDEIDGFKIYLDTAEKDRFEKLNPPDVTPQMFEKYLPYAIALDCENQWSKKFEAEAAAAAAAGQQGYGYTPIWYTGNSFSSLGAAGFASAIGSSLASSAASASTAPGSSSGSGGGGFSGGGGGGGGGGGW
jgi:uncharacterized membrane protein YgcG